MSNQAQVEWVRIAAVDDVDEDDVIQIELQGHCIALYKVEGTFYATDDLCTHEEASLSDGYLDGTVIECPLHQGTFCIKTGRPLQPPVEIPVRTYEVEVRGTDVMLRYPDGRAKR